MVYEENEKTIQEEVEEDTELKEMIQESRKEYREGKYKTTREIIDKMYKKDFTIMRLSGQHLLKTSLFILKLIIFRWKRPGTL
ncbi:hypothetical protein [Lentibacillus salinarum]|uniref:Uncharacterized protein n=1 Tax=Lentibacillus salinarum TaxID=446820 RepID=A0ABW3ZRX8_9BACI